MPVFNLLISGTTITIFVHKDKLRPAHLHTLRSTTFSQLNQYFSKHSSKTSSFFAPLCTGRKYQHITTCARRKVQLLSAASVLLAQNCSRIQVHILRHLLLLGGILKYLSGSRPQLFTCCTESFPFAIDNFFPGGSSQQCGNIQREAVETCYKHGKNETISSKNLKDFF